jgi:hypothetical protein
MNSVWSATTPTPTELHVSNKSSLQLPRPQVNTQVNTQATPDKATTTLRCKHPQLQQTISKLSLVETACVPETS